jgi:hypothetical protein
VGFELFDKLTDNQAMASTAWNVMQRNGYNKMRKTDSSKHNINTRIIAFRAVHIVRETLAVVFERELLGFLHVGRLEHHAIATVARLPK